MELKNAIWLEHTLGLILTTFIDGRLLSANDEKSEIDWYGPLSNELGC